MMQMCHISSLLFCVLHISIGAALYDDIEVDPVLQQKSVEAQGEREVLSVIAPDGRERQFHIYLPPAKAAREGRGTGTLLFQFHGLNEHCETFNNLTGYIAFAHILGFYVVTPCGLPGLLDMNSWNAGVCCSGGIQYDDIGFFEGMISSVRDYIASKNSYPAFERVYLAGFSNGAMLSERLGCERSDIVEKVWSVSGVTAMYPGGPYSRLSCDRVYRGGKVSVVNVHGNKDILVPYEGTYFPEHFQDAETNMEGWAARNGCDLGGASTEIITDKFTRKEWSKCADPSIKVQLVSQDGGIHHWPRAASGWCATSNSIEFFFGIEASSLIK